MPFFLGVNHNRPHELSQWFLDCPMGKNRLAQIMSRLAKRAGLPECNKYTNHSVRRTMCTQLYQHGVPPVMIAQLTGHKNINSLSHYTVASEKQQRDMCDILQNPLQAASAPLPGPVPSTSSVAPAPAALQSCESASVPQIDAALPGSLPNQLSTNVTKASGLLGFLNHAILNGPITININIPRDYKLLSQETQRAPWCSLITVVFLYKCAPARL